MSKHGLSLCLTVIFLFNNFVNFNEASTIASNIASTTEANGHAQINETLMEPVKVVETRLMLDESRRRLNGFQICSLCTCCGGAKGVCLSSPCCYAINCNIPNRPFGFCSFTPRTCNCLGCRL